MQTFTNMETSLAKLQEQSSALTQAGGFLEKIMEILVNRKKINIDTTEIHTLQELVKTIEENIISKAGHVLTQIEVNQSMP